MVRKLSATGVLRKRVKREIRTSFKQFVSVILIAALAITLFCGLTANYKKLERRVNLLYESTNVADLWVFFNDMSADDLERLSQIPGVEAVERRAYLPLSVNGNSVTVVLTDGEPSISTPQALSEQPAPYAGEEPAITGHSWYIDRGFAERYASDGSYRLSLPLGSLLQDQPYLNLFLEIMGSNLREGKEHVLAGEDLQLTMAEPTLMLHPEAITEQGYLTMTTEEFYAILGDCLSEYYEPLGVELALTLIGKLDLYNQAVLSASDVQSVKDAVRTMYDGSDALLMICDLDGYPANAIIQSDIVQARQLTYVFPVIFFLVSVLVILTTITQMINRERTQIGALKAIGVPRGKILWHYMSYGVTLCLIGSIIGLIVGPLLIPAVMDMKNNLLYQLPAAAVPFAFLEYLSAIGLLVGLAALVSFAVCRSTVNSKPAEAMRPVPPKKSRKTALERVKGWNRLPLSARMAYRNVVRKPSRALMVVLGVLGCTALLVCGFGIDNTLNHSIDTEVYEIFPSDVSVTYSAASDQVGARLAELDGVAYVEEYIVASVKVQCESVRDTDLHVLQKDSQIFGTPLSDDGVVISDKISKKIGAGVGDVVTVLIGSRRLEKTVTAVYSSGFTQGVFITREQVTDLLTLPTNAWIKAEDPAAQDAVAELVRGVDGVRSAMSTNGFLELADDTLASIRIITATLKVFAILLAVVVLYNLTLLNFKERNRDIATLKVLGFSDREVGRSLIIEVMALTLIGTVIGLFFGFPIMKLMLSINETELLSFLYYIHPLSYLYASLITLLTALVINLIMGKFVHRVKMVESLKSVE